MLSHHRPPTLLFYSPFDCQEIPRGMTRLTWDARTPDSVSSRRQSLELASKIRIKIVLEHASEGRSEPSAIPRFRSWFGPGGSRVAFDEMGEPGEVTPEAVLDGARSRSRLLSQSERRKQENCGKS